MHYTVRDRIGSGSIESVKKTDVYLDILSFRTEAVDYQ